LGLAFRDIIMFIYTMKIIIINLKIVQEVKYFFKVSIDFIKSFLRIKKNHISDAPQMTSTLEARLDDIEKDIKTGKNFSKVITDKNELEEYLSTI